jgi:hypothetical protein
MCIAHGDRICGIPGVCSARFALSVLQPEEVRQEEGAAEAGTCGPFSLAAPGLFVVAEEVSRAAADRFAQLFGAGSRCTVRGYEARTGVGPPGRNRLICLYFRRARERCNSGHHARGETEFVRRFRKSVHKRSRGTRFTHASSDLGHVRDEPQPGRRGTGATGRRRRMVTGVAAEASLCCDRSEPTP